MIRLGLMIASLAALTACGERVISPEVAAKRCEERARAAQGPTGGVTFGVNNRTGASTSAKIGISSDFIQGRDPDAVYDRCILELTGESPMRRPVLR